MQYVDLHCPAEIHKAFPEIDIIRRGAYVALKPLYTFSIYSAFQNIQAAIPYTLMHPIPSEMLAFELNADDMQQGLPPL